MEATPHSLTFRHIVICYRGEIMQLIRTRDGAYLVGRRSQILNGMLLALFPSSTSVGFGRPFYDACYPLAELFKYIFARYIGVLYGVVQEARSHNLGVKSRSGQHQSYSVGVRYIRCVGAFAHLVAVCFRRELDGAIYYIHLRHLKKTSMATATRIMLPSTISNASG